MLPQPFFFTLCKLLGSRAVAFLYRKIGFLKVLMFLPCYGSVDYKDRVRTILDYYSPKYLNEHSYYEVFCWYKEFGFEDIQILKQPISVVGRKV